MIYPNIQPDHENHPYQQPTQPYWPTREEAQRQSFQQADFFPPMYPQPITQAHPVSQQPRRKSRLGAVLVLIAVLTLVLGIGGFSGWEFARSSAATSTPIAQSATQPTTATQQGNNTTEAMREAAIAKAEPAVVQVSVNTNQGQQIGSGVIIDKRGYIVTNNHVVSGEQSIEVMLFDGSKATNVQLVGTDPENDLAVLKIQPTPNMAVVTIGDSSKLHIGQEVLAIGNPLGITQTATRGIVSALNRSVTEQGGATIANAIQTDAAINPGNSGGALVDLQGNLVGIPTLGAVDPETNTPANGVGFAIPSSRVSTTVSQIIQHGTAQ